MRGARRRRAWPVRGGSRRSDGDDAAAALASEPGEIVFAGDWYDFGAKYTQGSMELKVPARISRAHAHG